MALICVKLSLYSVNIDNTIKSLNSNIIVQQPFASKVLLLMILAGVAFGCIGIKHLGKDELLLWNQKVKGGRHFEKEEIKTLFSYQPNGKILFLPFTPYVALYQAGLKNYDTIRYSTKKEKIASRFEPKISRAGANTKRIAKLKGNENKQIAKQDIKLKDGNRLMRLGEPISKFDTAMENKTVHDIEAYVHSKGFFNAQVHYTTDTASKKISTTYHIEQRNPYVIDSIFYDIPDTTVLNLILQNSEISLLQKSAIYEQDNLTKERDRMNELLLNNGYYDFNRRYVSYAIDSISLGGHRIIVGINLEQPTETKTHHIFKIDTVFFTTDADVTGVSTSRTTHRSDNIYYKYYFKKYSEKILNRRVFIYPDSVYSKNGTLETQRQLYNMDMFKFININYDTTGGHVIASLFTSPLKKYETSTEAGLNVSQGLPGPFLSANLKNRNTFHGLEIMELGGRAGFEGLSGATSTGKPFSSLEYGLNLSFTFPQFLFPFSDKYKNHVGQFNPRTRLGFGMNYTNRTEYLRSIFNTSLAYSWQNYRKNRTYTINVADINFIESETSTAYLAFLKKLQVQGNNLINSFKPSFVSSAWASVIYNISDYGNRKEKSSYFRYYVEMGGNVSSLLERYGVLKDTTEIYQFGKFMVDYRHSNPYNSKITMAYRIHAGICIPYGDNKTLPYEKFFFAGGSNSIRAWAPRRLGPGSYAPVDTTTTTVAYNNNLEQPAEILIESTIEFRHKILGFVQGALFIDAGNVWTLRDDPARPGSQFKANKFINQIALGVGYGVRLDLSFLLLRLDAGYKLKDPADYNAKGIPDINSFASYKRIVWNIGIGLPF